jgi:FlaA1/EpsC-like NDP-sugar epimerase
MMNANMIKLKIKKAILMRATIIRALLYLFTDMLIISVCLNLALLLRFDFFLADDIRNTAFFWLPVYIIPPCVAMYVGGVYSFSWRFFGLHECFIVLRALFASMLLLFAANTTVQEYYQAYALPRSTPFSAFILAGFFIIIFRVSRRLIIELAYRSRNIGKSTLIIGAGGTGERIVREMFRNEHIIYKPIGFVDDNAKLIQTTIQGVRVLGALKDIPRVVKNKNVRAAIITISTLSHSQISLLYDMLKQSGIMEIKIVPSINRLPHEAVSVKELRDINVEDLLCREAVKIEASSLGKLLNNKTVLVTGAGGSIGSEIVRQLRLFNPKAIIVFEIDETELNNLLLELAEFKTLSDTEIIPMIGDLRDVVKLKRLLSAYRIDIVFHAAAYKHIHLMEYFPEEAVKTNIIGTWHFEKLCLEANVEKFINISTDKAVNPTSIMGASKRMAEYAGIALNSQNRTKFISVRFGNVLGSRGSVIPMFIEQIKKGGPVTVTHPEMTRYFMTIPEAVALVLQAATMGKGGEVFVLDMGEPVRIVTLAEDLIKLNNLEPYVDIDIIYTGLRPGEKLFEELLTAEEGTDKTYHEKIFMARQRSVFTLKDIEEMIKNFENMILSGEPELIRNTLGKYIVFYIPPAEASPGRRLKVVQNQ